MSKTAKLICLVIAAVVVAGIFVTIPTKDTPYIGPAPPRGDFSLCEGFTLPYTPGIKKNGFPFTVRTTETAPCSATANPSTPVFAITADLLIGGLLGAGFTAALFNRQRILSRHAK